MTRERHTRSLRQRDNREHLHDWQHDEVKLTLQLFLDLTSVGKKLGLLARSECRGSMVAVVRRVARLVDIAIVLLLVEGEDLAQLSCHRWRAGGARMDR